MIKFEKNNENCCVVAQLKNVRKHPNADRLQIATVLGESIIVGLEAKEDDKVLYFDSNLCLSNEYCEKNNLFSRSSLNSDPTKKGYFGDKGRVRPTTLRGEKSYGFVAQIDSLNYVAENINENDFPLGQEFNSVNGVEICKKYIVMSTKNSNPSHKRKEKKDRKVSSKMFPEHWDTKKFLKEIDNVPPNQMIYLELKEHGTSGRIANVLADKKIGFLKRILNKLGADFNTQFQIVMNGTRRVNLTRSDSSLQFYKGDIRDVVFNKLKDHVKQNEQLYFEICGYDTNGSWIQKGFPYGCEPGQHRITLYRVSINTPDGGVYDLSREYVYRRAEELGINAPYLFEKFFYDGDKETLIKKVESFTDGKDPIDPSHIREGVVLWFMDKKGKWTCLKNKSFDFLELEDKQKDSGTIDIEDHL